MIRYPKYIWNYKQKLALRNLYSSLIGDYYCQDFSIDERCNFWLTYKGKTSIFGYYKNPYSTAYEWSPEEKKISFLMLMEYEWLDTNNLIDLNGK